MIEVSMDVSVQEVDIPSEDGTPKKYFLRVDCRGQDLGSGFQVLLTDGELAWRGEVTDDGVHCEAEELEMQKEKYRSSVTYNFTLTPQPTSTTTTTTTTLAYEKFRLGAVELGPVAEPVEAVRELLELDRTLLRADTAAAADQKKASRQQRPRKPPASPTAEDLFDDF
ncbi:hypothetical protein CRUP_003914 [Coryphaenoides rupestris]|nr:hypothetical protein CRUP_003914 [Coryphaenoides rupestris]